MKKSYKQERNDMAKKALPEIDKLVKKFGLGVVRKVVQIFVDQGIVQRKLEEVELEVKKMKLKLRK